MLAQTIVVGAPMKMTKIALMLIIQNNALKEYISQNPQRRPTYNKYGSATLSAMF